MAAGAQESRTISGKALFQKRKKRMTQKIPIERYLVVAFIGNPLQSVLSRIVFDLPPRNVKQRPKQLRLSFRGRDGARRDLLVHFFSRGSHHRHCTQTLYSCTAQQLQQQRFCLVVQMLGQHHVIGLEISKDAIAFFTCCGFQTGSWRVRDFYSGNFKGNVSGLAQVSAEFTPFVRIWADAVVDMNGGEQELHLRGKRDQQVQQRCRIHSAAQGNGQMIAGLDLGTQYMLRLARNIIWL